MSIWRGCYVEALQGTYQEVALTLCDEALVTCSRGMATHPWKTRAKPPGGGGLLDYIFAT